MNFDHHKNGNISSSNEEIHSDFTEEEIQDILRYANEHDIQGEARVQLFKWIRNKRAAQSVHKLESETN